MVARGTGQPPKKPVARGLHTQQHVASTGLLGGALPMPKTAWDQSVL
jgi:hypothetical protein